MQKESRPQVVLSVLARPVFLPLATSFAENSAKAFGLGDSEALALTLATEEIFGYLCRAAAPDREVEIRCTSGGYYVREELLFRAEDFNMRAFNITASASFDDDAGIEETGLLIASRMVDRFSFSESDRGLRVSLVKEKEYPHGTDVAPPDPAPVHPFSVRAPEPEQLKTLARMAARAYDPVHVPPAFAFPGKVVDMAAAGDLYAAVAVGARGEIGGGVVWRRESSKLVECYGPFVFGRPAHPDAARSLIDFCIGAVARTDAQGLIIRCPTPELPDEYFEPLGSTVVRVSGGTLAELKAYYRHLEEDSGGLVWAHPIIHGFLAAQYGRLAFARDIHTVTDEGEMASPFAVLSAQFDRSRERVTLRPVWWGDDAHSTVESYVRTLRNEAIPFIFFEMDLGKPWQSLFTPALEANGFEPRLALPNGGRADVVVFQHIAGEIAS